MNCEGIAAILDTHRSARLTAAERAAVDTHLVACGDCAAAWHAQSELTELPLPPVPAALLDRALRAARAQPTVAPRRWRATFVVGGALLAGAALAGIAVVSLTAPPSADTAAAPESTTPATATSPTQTAWVPVTNASVANDAAPPDDGSIATEFVNTSLQLVPFVRVNPDYPLDGLAEKLEGRVVIEFSVTATGEVEDAHVVESTDARFDASALAAIMQWKYLPRIVAGKRAATDNIRTAITFQLQPTAGQATSEQAYRPIGPGLPLDSAAFETTMLTAWQRVIADDLRGAELALDEFRATYALSPFITGEVWNAYAYVYTLQANFDRAIDAYEASVAVFAQAGLPTQGRWVELANLYLARNQYDMALNTLLRPRRASNNTTRRMPPEAEALMDKLRALGITEETVPPP